MRMIDADELKMHIFLPSEAGRDAYKLGWNDALEAVSDNAPTIDPVKRGRWLDIDGDGIVYQCDQCGGLSDYESAFCAGCGASMMDGGERDEADRC